MHATPPTCLLVLDFANDRCLLLTPVLATFGSARNSPTQDAPGVDD
jgi:hypothetical protein